MLILSIDSNGRVFAQEAFNLHEINGKEIVYSQFIPLYGTFSVQMEYTIPLEMHNAELVHAGDSLDIIVTANKPGKLVTTFLKDEKILGSSEDELKIGEEKTIEIPESIVGQIFAMPQIHIQPKVKGPATITPEYMLFDSETVKRFRLFVDDNIGTFDSIRVEMNTVIKMTNGGNLNIAIAKIPLGKHVSEIQTQNTTKQIQLKKIIPTNLHLQVIQGDMSEHIKVKTILTDDLQVPITIPMHSVEIYVDGVPQTKVQPNEWTENIFVGGGTHNFQARFPETRDPGNIAITYVGVDSAVQTITIMSNSIPDEQEIQCEPGMIFKEGQCVKDENKEDWFSGMKGGGCLIATAAYGTELAPQIQSLREIRDNTIFSTSSGAAFMTGFNQVYYFISPTIADMERKNPIFKEGVRAFITPMVSTLSIMTLADEGSESSVLGLGISVIVINIGIYIVGPIKIIQKIYRYYKTQNMEMGRRI